MVETEYRGLSAVFPDILQETIVFLRESGSNPEDMIVACMLQRSCSSDSTSRDHIARFLVQLLPMMHVTGEHEKASALSTDSLIR